MARKSAPVTVADHVHSIAKRLFHGGVVFAHGTTDPVAEAAYLVAEAMQVHPDVIESMAAEPVSEAAASQLERWVEARIATRRPAAYLTNRMYMRGLPFYVDERVIIPRSFIGEILDDHFTQDSPFRLLDPSRVRRVLDLCTGSACLAVLAARTFPDARIDAVDLSADALAVAARNVAHYDLEGRIALRRGDLYAGLGGARYDLIFTNPPYVDAGGMAALPDECRHEPAMAFDGGADGLDLVRKILDGAKAHLNEGGGLLCEVGRGRDNVDAAYPEMPLLWLDTEESEGEVFWIAATDLF